MRSEGGPGGQGDWEADWQGTGRRQLRMDLTLTPGQRIEALERMLELAHEAGALEKAARRKQRQVDAQWEIGRVG